MRSRSLVAISASALLVTSTALVTASASSAAPQRTAAPSASPSSYSGSFAISGKSAEAYVVPRDVHEVWTSTRPDGTTQTRYQQTLGNASVFGGQVTLIKNPAGETTSVVGAYFPDLRPTNSVKVTKGKARSVVESKVGTRGTFRNELQINPRTGKYFYEVQSLRADERPVRWVDADSGEIVKAYSGLTEGSGTGVKGDTKQLDTVKNAATSLYELKTGDDRQETYDLQNAPVETGGVMMTDSNDVWDFNKGIASPSQAAAVDAHYYAGVVDDFYGQVFNRDSLDNKGLRIVSKVHYSTRYCNAFWNGQYMTYGDGDGRTCLPLSGGLDVDGHEMTHGVTEFTSNLIYENESGALNESFSDMMGNTMEYYADAKKADPAGSPDWLIGEDVIKNRTGNNGFRNMGDPAEFGDPSDYSLLYTGTADSGGVHSNSGISNHAYYLAVNGGKNASCTANAAHGVLLTTKSCDVTVPALGLDKAEHIFYDGFTSLPEYANFCDARNATVAAAVDTGDDAAMGAVWDAVGVNAGCATGVPGPKPCTTTINVPSSSFESEHPYLNNTDCTWTYTNPTANFAFHFTQMDTEKDFDYVYVKDAAGNKLATYTGTKHGKGFYGPCIPGTTGSVNLVSDPGVTAQGFVVDGVKQC
jgi:Zn-dependent metalloprotease